MPNNDKPGPDTYEGASPRKDDAGSFKHDNRNKPGKKTTEGEETLDNLSVDEVNASKLEVKNEGSFKKRVQKPGETTNSSQESGA